MAATQETVGMAHASPGEPQVHGGATNPRWLAATASTVSHFTTIVKKG